MGDGPVDSHPAWPVVPTIVRLDTAVLDERATDPDEEASCVFSVRYVSKRSLGGAYKRAPFSPHPLTVDGRELPQLRGEPYAHKVNGRGADDDGCSSINENEPALLSCMGGRGWGYEQTLIFAWSPSVVYSRRGRSRP